MEEMEQWRDGGRDGGRVGTIMYLSLKVKSVIGLAAGRTLVEKNYVTKSQYDQLTLDFVLQRLIPRLRKQKYQQSRCRTHHTDHQIRGTCPEVGLG